VGIGKISRTADNDAIKDFRRSRERAGELEKMTNIQKMIAFEEGKRLDAYPDTKGVLTVGIGHNLEADSALDILKRHVRLHDKITEEECTALFKRDLDKVYAGIKRNIPWFDGLQEKYKPVIINMIFQMGIGGTLEFKNTLKAMHDNRPLAVEKGMRNSKWFRDTPNRVNRLILLVKGETVKGYE
jgi:lysozyme